MLVKANIHGSMNGKPNKGPKGIISLDGGGSYADETKTYTPQERDERDKGQDKKKIMYNLKVYKREMSIKILLQLPKIKKILMTKLIPIKR